MRRDLRDRLQLTPSSPFRKRISRLFGSGHKPVDATGLANPGTARSNVSVVLAHVPNLQSEISDSIGVTS